MSVLQWAKVSDMDPESILFKCLLYGDSGAGKTYCASTAPSPVFLLTEPNGLPSIRAARPDAIVVQADEQHGGLQTVRQFFMAAQDGSLARDTGAKTIVLDSLNELQRMMRDEILLPKIGTPREGKFELQDWGTLTDKMRKLVRMFRDLPFHVIGITHAEAVVPEGSSDRYIKPMFEGRKLPNEVAGYFSAVGYVFRHSAKDQNDNHVMKHQVLFHGPPTVLCKKLPGMTSIEEPNVAEWIERIGSFDASNDNNESVEAELPKARSKSRRRRGQ